MKMFIMMVMMVVICVVITESLFHGQFMVIHIISSVII